MRITKTLINKIDTALCIVAWAVFIVSGYFYVITGKQGFYFYLFLYSGLYLGGLSIGGAFRGRPKGKTIYDKKRGK
jgi:hypothetical protein